MIRPIMNKPLHTWTIDSSSHDSRLDMFVSGQLPELSRSQIQKRIKDGTILLNKAKTSVHHFLKSGDLVEMMEGPQVTPQSEKVTETTQETPLPPLVILRETSDWLVIHKPAGLMVHPDGVQEKGTLIDLLLAHDPKIASVGGSPERPGIVHRLDKEVSGLMVIAKNQAAFESLQRQFAERRVKKTYLALVHNELSQNQEEGDIKFRIARSHTKARMAARPEQEEEGQAAWTHYRILKRFVGATLVELEILSGRTHQIRAHLLAMRTPIMGDPLYQLKKTDRRLVSPRLMLQSIGLDFDDPTTGERESFHLDPDPSFEHVIQQF